MLELDGLGDDAALIFLEIGWFAEGGESACCGVVGGYDYGGSSGYCERWGWWRLRDYHCLKELSVGLGCHMTRGLTCGGGQVVCVVVLVVGVIVKQEQALETRDGGYCET